MTREMKRLTDFIVLLGASAMIVLAIPNLPPNANAQTGPEEPVATMVSTSTGNGGMRTLADTVLPSTRYGFHIGVNRPSVTLPSVDVNSLTLEPEQVGINRTVELSPKTPAEKFVNPDGSQIIALIVRSSGASGIGVHFRNFALADGEELYVYGTAPDSSVFGPFTNTGPRGGGEFWSGTVPGDTLVIEFYERPGESGKGFQVFEISHIFSELDLPELRSNEPDILSCERDASCYADAEKNAVGRILFSKYGQWYVCTGTLLNDRSEDSTPYFLTANHCVSTQEVAQTVEVYWFYQTTHCNSGALQNWIHSPPGANLLATQRSNDFCLLRLEHDAPTGATFSGWDPNAQRFGTGVFALHHPDGYIPPSVQSYLRWSGGNIASTTFGCSASGLSNGYQASWTTGTIEQGSSGSGLWNSSHHLVGVLSCGPAPSRCNNSFGAYSKFANFYSQIQRYISCASSPAVTTNPATNVTTSSAKLNGTVNPHGLSTTVYFQYGRTSGYGSRTLNQIKTGSNSQTVFANVSRLSSSTRYHFRAVGTNSAGTRYGTDRTFTTQ